MTTVEWFAPQSRESDGIWTARAWFADSWDDLLSHRHETLLLSHNKLVAVQGAWRELCNLASISEVNQIFFGIDV